MPRLWIAVALFIASPVFAQAPGAIYAPGPVYTPEIQLGSATQPSTITVPPVVEVTGTPPEAAESNAVPASTALLASRHFDFIVSPIAPTPTTRGSMADTSISLGEYARKLREEKQQASRQTTPNAIAKPSDSQ